MIELSSLEALIGLEVQMKMECREGVDSKKVTAPWDPTGIVEDICEEPPLFGFSWKERREVLDESLELIGKITETLLADVIASPYLDKVTMVHWTPHKRSKGNPFRGKHFVLMTDASYADEDGPGYGAVVDTGDELVIFRCSTYSWMWC
jgi:hypothetical protein